MLAVIGDSGPRRSAVLKDHAEEILMHIEEHTDAFGGSHFDDPVEAHEIFVIIHAGHRLGAVPEDPETDQIKAVFTQKAEIFGGIVTDVIEEFVLTDHIYAAGDERLSVTCDEAGAGGSYLLYAHFADSPFPSLAATLNSDISSSRSRPIGKNSIGIMPARHITIGTRPAPMRIPRTAVSDWTSSVPS